VCVCLAAVSDKTRAALTGTINNIDSYHARISADVQIRERSFHRPVCGDVFAPDALVAPRRVIAIWSWRARLLYTVSAYARL